MGLRKETLEVKGTVAKLLWYIDTMTGKELRWGWAKADIGYTFWEVELPGYCNCLCMGVRREFQCPLFGI